MNQPLLQIIAASSLTVLIGVFTFVIGQIFQTAILEPVHTVRRTISEVADALVYYENVYSNPGVPRKDLMDEANVALRRLASRLLAHRRLVPFYGAWAWCRFVPSSDNIKLAHRNLIGLSNGVYGIPTDHNGNSSYIMEANRKNKETIVNVLDLDLE